MLSTGLDVRTKSKYDFSQGTGEHGDDGAALLSRNFLRNPITASNDIKVPVEVFTYSMLLTITQT